MHYVMSDIHGRYDIFERMLSRIGFGDGDVLHILGDAADRGPDGVRVLQYCMAHGDVRLIMGNHEDMAVKSLTGTGQSRERWRRIWMDNGGAPTEEGLAALSADGRDSLLGYLEGLPDHEDVDIGDRRFVLAHASWPGPREDVLWNAPKPFMPKWGTDREVILGHTPVCMFFPDSFRYVRGCGGSHMRIERFPGFTAIDCGCGLPDRYKKRALACLRLDDMEEFYEPL